MNGNITFIGLGTMGYSMAGNVRKRMSRSDTLFVHDVVRSACERFVSEFESYGPTKIVDVATTGVDESTTVISIVPRGVHVREVYLEGPDCVICATRKDRLILECSTIEVQTTKDVGSQVSEAGVGHYVDAPVSGGPTGAKAGTLSFMIGEVNGTPIAHRIHKIVTMMGIPSKVVFCGKLGNGLAAKISNNYLSFCNMMSVAEAMSLGIRLGVDKNILFDCIKNSSGNSYSFNNNQPCPDLIPGMPSNNGFTPRFKPFMMVKDLELASTAGQHTGIQTTMGDTALETLRRAMHDARCKDLDATSVWLLINGLN